MRRIFRSWKTGSVDEGDDDVSSDLHRPREEKAKYRRAFRKIFAFLDRAVAIAGRVEDFSELCSKLQTSETRTLHYRRGFVFKILALQNSIIGPNLG
uniref:Uncharacterized protein n=1 Tax=Rhizophora mucronata TaxID=61149 RepID=A0A2P2L037_RHIMU